MPGRHKVNLLVIPARAGIKNTSSLNLGHLFGGDWDSRGSSKWLAIRQSRVSAKDSAKGGAEELAAGGSNDPGLADFDINTLDMVGVEDLATLEDDNPAILEAKGAGFNADPNTNRARRVFDVGYTDHVSAQPVYIHRVQGVVELDVAAS